MKIGDKGVEKKSELEESSFMDSPKVVRSYKIIFIKLFSIIELGVQRSALCK